MRTIIRSFSMTAVSLGMCGLLFGQSDPKFTELSRIDHAHLDRQREVIASAAKNRYAAVLKKTRNDLPILQKMIDDKVFTSSQTYELQCLGVAFGDVLASELPLHWVMIRDEYGKDPTLRYKQTSIYINALTMISKRIERREPVNLAELLRMTREHLTELEIRYP